MRMQKWAASAVAVTVAGSLLTFSAPNSGATPGSAVQRCTGGQLHTSLGPADAAAGSEYRNVRFRNTGERCAVSAWPRITYARTNGKRVGRFAEPPAHPPRTIVLRHGEIGRVLLRTPNPGNFPRRLCKPRAATKLKTYVPGGKLRPANKHLNKLPRRTRVCTTAKGRPSISRLR